MRFIFVFKVSFICADLYRISYFKDPYIRLITSNDKILSTSFIEPKKDKRFYFNFIKIAPGTLQLQSEDSKLMLTNAGKLKFTDKNDKLTHFNFVLTEIGGFKILQDDLCLTLINNDTLEMAKCSNDKNQIFMILKENRSLLKPYGEVKYIYKPSYKYE